MKFNTYEDVTLSEARELCKAPESILVDVREPWEFEEFNEGGLNIPLAEIRKQRERLSGFSTLIVICTNGVRSKVAAQDFCRVPAWSDKRIYHVKGGLLEAE